MDWYTLDNDIVMSQQQETAVAASSASTLSSSEKNASLAGSSAAATSVPRPKLRSCLVCRTRKVRCDKQSPCSNCRRARTACIFPSSDRQPRWARRFEPRTNNVATSDALAPQDGDPHVDQVLNRLHNLENLVKELSGQLEQARATISSSRGASSASNSPGSSNQSREAENPSPDTHMTNVRQQFGRLVVQDAGRNRYVSSSFWSRIDDEVGLLVVTDRMAEWLTDCLRSSKDWKWTHAS